MAIIGILFTIVVFCFIVLVLGLAIGYVAKLLAEGYQKHMNGFVDKEITTKWQKGVTVVVILIFLLAKCTTSFHVSITS